MTKNPTSIPLTQIGKQEQKAISQQLLSKKIAESKMLNITDDNLVKEYSSKGINVNTIREEIQKATKHPYFQAGRDIVKPLKKTGNILGVYRKLAELSSKRKKIERVPYISRADFLENYYATNTPVIITDIMSEWPALNSWKPEYFQKKYGDIMVEIEFTSQPIKTDNKLFKYFEKRLKNNQKLLPLGDYVDMVVNGASGNDYYMTANNHNLEKEEMKPLLEEIVVFPEYLDKNKIDKKIFLFFGPPGTTTPLHYDPFNSLFSQVYGRKQLKLISPNQTPFLYNQIGNFSDVDCENPSFDKHPLFKNVTVMDIIVEPGETLFIPVGWWHEVKALDISISVSFSNFLFPNEYDFFGSPV